MSKGQHGMKIIFAGTPATAVPSLEQLLHDGYEVCAVLTREPKPRGRKRILTKSEVHQAAEKHGIPVYTPKNLRGEESENLIRELAPDAVVVVAYGVIIPKNLLDVPTHGWINLHFSLLPRWRGAAPVNYAIAAGDTHTGTAIFRIGEGLDTGPVFDIEETQIGANETAGELLERLAFSGAQQISRVLQKIGDGELQAREQEGEATTAPQFTSEWGHIDWTQPAEVVSARVRSATPVPGAWTTLHGQRFKIGKLQSLEHNALSNGEACAHEKQGEGSVSGNVEQSKSQILEGTAVVRGEKLMPGEISAEGYVGTGTMPIRLGEVAPPGKTWMKATDWLRGARLEQGTCFGS